MGYTLLDDLEVVYCFIQCKTKDNIFCYECSKCVNREKCITTLKLINSLKKYY